jgi:hypothetical protein
MKEEAWFDISGVRGVLEAASPWTFSSSSLQDVQIKSTNPFSTIEQAIRFNGLCNVVREQDFDLLKHIIDFLVQYNFPERRTALSFEERDFPAHSRNKGGRSG